MTAANQTYPRKLDAIEFTVGRFVREPKHFRFFAVGESLYFGDEAQIRRVNAEPESIDEEDLRQWSVTAGDCIDEVTADWLAARLNASVGR